MSNTNKLTQRDTIYALATGAVVSAIAVFRISGPKALHIGAMLSGRDSFIPRRLDRCLLKDPATNDILDDALLVFFPENNSFTGEALLEIHAHGGEAVRRRLALSIEDQGARLATPGEFARRRFDAGLMNLNEAEGLAALIDAQTETQRRQALRVLSGEIGERAKAWRVQLIDVLALLETGIDFAEEEIGQDIELAAAKSSNTLREALSKELDQIDHDESILSRPTISLVGPPNAGKSSLMNSLAQREVSIVTALPGTTRDIIRTEVIVEGVHFELVDTAGLREAADEIEGIGVDRARSIIEVADVRILVLSADTWAENSSLGDLISSAELIIWNKSDIMPAPPPALLTGLAGELIITSAYDSASTELVLSKIHNLLERRGSVLSPISGSKRRKKILFETLGYIEAAQQELRSSRVELAIESLRSASTSLSHLIGRIDHEDVLDDVFARFCIGK